MKIQIDFTGVVSGGLVPEGEVTFAVLELKPKKKEGSKDAYLEWKLEAQSPHRGIVYHNTSTSEASKWALKGFLEDMGYDIPDGAIELDPDEVVGEKIGGTVFHEVYDGKTRAKISATYSVQPGAPGAPAGEAADDVPAAIMNKAPVAAKPAAEKPAETKPAGLPKVSADSLDAMSFEELVDLAKKYDLKDADGKPLDPANWRNAKARAGNAVLDALETAKLLAE